VEILGWAEADVPDELRVQALALQERARPRDPALRPRSLLLVDDGRVLAALEILSKEIVHRGERYAASGLCDVVTDEGERRKGYGRTLVEAARREIEASGADLGIFTCDRPLQAFYERAGWQLLAGSVLVGGTPAAPFPSDRLDKVTMASFFSERARANAAAFVGARIELYPGEIERLW
jgi:GNAT superfamily N-acetyltransferase